MAASVAELLELDAAVLGTVKRLLREMDLGERVRRQVQLSTPERDRTGLLRRYRAAGSPAHGSLRRTTRPS